MNIRHILRVSVCLLLAGCDGQLEVSGIKPGSEEFGRFPEVMRQFPVWQPIDTPEYDFEVRDGARKPSGGIRYTTGLKPEEIIQLFQSSAESLNCQLNQSEDHQVQYMCDNDPARGLELYIRSVSASDTEVNILFLETTPEFEKVSF